eukprot:691586_1
MSALTVLFLIMATKTIKSQTENACVWGRNEGLYDHDAINGQFRYQGDFNSAPYYTKQYGTNILYLFQIYFGGTDNYHYIISRNAPTNTNVRLYHRLINMRSF